MTDDWQDISTAPTDGTVIRLKYPDGAEYVAPWPPGRPLDHDERKTLGEWPDHRQWTPTHWRPYP
jgi:hypothetical protein